MSIKAFQAERRACAKACDREEHGAFKEVKGCLHGAACGEKERHFVD